MNKQKFYPGKIFLKAFTLIELLVVIAIFGLLSSIVLIVVRDRIEQAKYARSMTYSASIKHVLWEEVRGEWKFEEIPTNNPNVYDTSGNNNNGTWFGICNRVPNNVSSQLGNTAQLAYDSNTYIQIDNKESLNPTKEITIEAWINLNNTTINRWVLYKNGQYYLAVEGNPAQRARFYLNWEGGGGDDWYPTKNIFLAQKWHHYVATYDGSYMRIFVDTQEVESGKLISPPGKIILTTSGKLFIGGGSGNFAGLIDEVRIYGRALTSAEIQQHYAEGAKEHGLTLK